MKRDLEIRSAEGLPIRGTLDLPAKPMALVVVVHGFKGFREWGFFPWISEQLSSRHIAACRFDMSRNGIGDGSERFERLDLFEDDTYSTQLSDLYTVLDYLRTIEALDHVPVFLLGHSRGGAIAILGAVERIRDLRGVITWSAIATVDRWDELTKKEWQRTGYTSVINSRTGQEMRMSLKLLEDFEANRDRFDVRKAASRLDLPMLVVHGAADESVPPGDARSITAAARDASLVVIAGGTHTFGAIHPLVNVPRELRLAMEMTIRFVETWS